MEREKHATDQFRDHLDGLHMDGELDRQPGRNRRLEQ